MTLMNWILHLLPKKKVDIESLNHASLSSVRLEEASASRTIIRQGVSPAKDTKNQSESGQYEILEREIMPEKIICPDCGQITLEGLEYCDKCGGDLTNY